MKKLLNLHTFRRGDHISGRHKNNCVYSDAKVKQDSDGKYIEHKGERFNLTEFYHLIKQHKKEE